ncbi:MAG: (d)CMP kinase [Acutalibacteraceae bacterium]|nr:(d)CMP kinase [Acutalibacteraceae bacterium]
MLSNGKISVAIDGPAGAGKSSISRIAAKRLGFIYVDTGALYRAVGLKFSLLGADTSLDCDIDGILADTTVDIRFKDGEQRVYLDGRDVSSEIRTPTASMMASAVSARPQVRAFLLEMQRKLARENNVVMDGRDIGTVVLPDAKVKIYLTASAEVRAERRFKELKEKGSQVTFKEVYDDMIKRDWDDMHREIAPLKQAEDAVLADTSDCSFEESVELILSIVKEKRAQN